MHRSSYTVTQLDMGNRRVLLLGATGLIGSQLLPLLLADETIARVSVLTRTPLGRDGYDAETLGKLDARVVDFDRLEERAELFTVDQIFSTLGTTMRRAGSRERFRIVDYEYPFEAAQLGQARGVRHFLVVSAAGASTRSLNFYSRVKGQLDDAVRTLGFRSVTIARPSLLLGDRREHRTGEEMAKRFGVLFPPKWKPIHARTVARALADAARTDAPGVRILESRDMRRHYERAG